jgi:2,4-dienoyl-CoA reductase-like NADH-dependent reductase (Old Yellow Enzyme family)
MKTLFEQTKLGNISVPNRFVRSATWENLPTKEGYMTEELYKVYETLAKSDIGLIITGYANVVEEEQPNAGMMGIYNDYFIDQYKKLTDIIHSNGSTIIMQIAYGGTKTTYNVGERIILAPSEVPERGTKVSGKPMTKDEIDYIVEAFAEAGRRVKESGFDGVEIHAAHTYLINQFLSPYYNRRTDEYGGSLENRMRFLIEIFTTMREKVGDDFPILVKLTATEFFEGGLSFEETKLICKRLEELGVDGIEVSGNIHGQAKAMVGNVFDEHAIQEEGYFLEYAKIIAAEVKVPVITVGGFRDINNLEKILNETNINYFALSRPLLAEPGLIKRWKTGNRKPAICIRCSKCRTSHGNYCTVLTYKK